MKSTMLIQTANSDKRSDLPIEINNCGCYTDTISIPETTVPREEVIINCCWSLPEPAILPLTGLKFPSAAEIWFYIYQKSRRSTVLIKTPGLLLLAAFFRHADRSNHKKHHLSSGMRQVDNMPEAIDFFNRLIRAKMQTGGSWRICLRHIAVLTFLYAHSWCHRYKAWKSRWSPVKMPHSWAFAPANSRKLQHECFTFQPWI